MRHTLQIGTRIRNVARLTQIVNILARHGLASMLQRSRILSTLSRETVRGVEVLAATAKARGNKSIPDAQRFCQALEELGPAFVKLGQLLALREDILPEAYTKELKKLYNNVDPVPFTDIQRILYEDLGAARLAQFSSIDPVPLAAGSIGQVHVAHLVSKQKVVVKVQRPGVAQALQVDLSLMEIMASLLERHVPESRVARPKATIEEFGRAALGELDFVREGANTAKIATNFSAIDHIHVPEIYWDLTTTRVLTMSYVAGKPLDGPDSLIAAGLDPKLLVARAVEMFMKMVFQDGLYHGDLHPGNFLALPSNDLCLIDFGVVIRLSRSLQEHLAGLLVALAHDDFDGLISHFMELTTPATNFNPEAFAQELANAIAPFLGLSLREMRAGNVLWDLARIAARHGAPMPRELILFLRNLACLEGVAAQLDPSFNVIKSCQSLTADIVAAMYSPEYLRKESFMIARDVAQLARQAPLQMRQILRSMLDGDLRLNIVSEDMDRMSAHLDRSASRLAVAMILGSLIIGSSILVFAKGAELPVNIGLLGAAGYSIAGLLALYVIWSMFRSKV